MEKNVKTWHPRLPKTPQTPTPLPQIKNPNHPTLPTSSINNHMHCKELPISMLQLPQQLSINKWRYQTAYPIFKVYHFSYDPPQYMGQIPSNCVLAKIVYQLPDVLLVDIRKPIDFDKLLYVMKTVLMACQKLVEKFGYFRVTDKMVGFNKEGICKIWVSQNLWENQVMLAVQDEEEAVDAIKQVIEQFIGESQVQRNFIYLIREERHTFVKMVQLIWEYSYENSILIPPYLENEKNIYQKPKKTHKKTYSNLPTPRTTRNSLQKQRTIQLKKYQQSHRNSREIFAPPQFKPICQHVSPVTSRLCSSPQSLFSNRLSQQYKVSKNRWSQFDAQKSHQSQPCLENNISNYTAYIKQPVMLKTSKSKNNQINLNLSPRSPKIKQNFNPFEKAPNKTYNIPNLNLNINLNTSKSKLKLNHNKMVNTPRKHGNSKSDFITRVENNHVFNIPQNISPYKENISVIQPYIISSQNHGNPDNTTNSSMKTSQNTSENTTTSTIVSTQNKQKMKNMIKQKIRINRQKKKVVKLQAINTVKSIGQFTQSQKRIIEESQNNQNSVLINMNLEMLQRMCQKIGTSYFHIDVDSQDGEPNGDEVKKGHKEKQHRRNGRIF